MERGINFFFPPLKKISEHKIINSFFLKDPEYLFLSTINFLEKWLIKPTDERKTPPFMES